MREQDQSQKIQSQLRKGLLDYIILKHVLKGETYPRALIGTLGESGLDIVEGTLYPLFLRLLKAGYVTHTWKEAAGHPRKYYKITPEGKKYLSAYTKEWNRMEKIISAI